MNPFHAFPKEHWRHPWTTNVVESPSASVRLRTDAAKRYKKVDRATPARIEIANAPASRFRVGCVIRRPSTAHSDGGWHWLPIRL